MSVNWSAIISAMVQAFAPKAAAVLPKIIPTVAASTPAIGNMTAGQLTGALGSLSKYASDVEAVWRDRGGDLQADLAVLEDGEDLAALLGVPFAGDAKIATAIFGYLLANAPAIHVAPGQGDLSYEHDANFKNR